MLIDLILRQLQVYFILGLVLSAFLSYSQADIMYKSSNDSLRTIVFFGDSLTAGYGVEQDEAFPALIQSHIDSLNWPFEVVNAGLSGETSAGGLRRVDWILQRPVDIFVLELGANDGLRGINLKTTEANLKKIIDKVRAKYPESDLVVVGMKMPPNFGPDYTKKFRELFPNLAKLYNAALVPFLLEGVVLVPEEEKLFRSNHPTAEGHKILAENVWKIVKPIAERRLDKLNPKSSN